jgi:benzoyl-CoA reductase/2-hydroxyglutaryl-CoA dehydratase subunit BcrC/BadD/HgdB
MPLRVFPTGSKPTAAEAYLPRNFCSLSKLILASQLDGDAPPLDAVVFTDEDDATRRLHDVWPACVRVPVWGFLEVPRRTSVLAVDRFARLLAAFGRDLERRTGESLSVGRLRAAIGMVNEQRRLLAELKQRWLAGGISTPAYRRLRRQALTEDPVTTNEALRSELEAARNVPDGTEASDSLRIFLLAELAAPNSLVRQIEAGGARVVGEDSGLDEQAIQIEVPSGGETVEALLAGLAVAYLDHPPAPRSRDLPRRLEHITRLAHERGAQAVLCAYSKFCDPYLAEYPALSAELTRLGLPSLLLELEDETLSGQHRTRVEAFLEMVRTR